MRKSLLLLPSILLSLSSVNGQSWKPDAATESVYVPDELGTVKDYDGNVYQTARFGDTWWMLENLKCKHFNDGTPVPFYKDIDEKRPKDDSYNYFTWFVNTASYGYPSFDEKNVDKYGLLYTWTAATNSKKQPATATYKYAYNVNGGLLPEGWKIADTTAWYDLAKRMESEEIVIGKWIENNSTSEATFDKSYVINIGLYLKTAPGNGWNEDASLSVADDKLWNKTGMNIVGAGKIGGDLNEDFSFPAPGLNSYTWFWTDQFVHKDSIQNGRRYVYFSNLTNEMTFTQNNGATHASVRGIKRIERKNEDKEDPLKIGNVTGSDDFLVYPTSTTSSFLVLSVKDTKYDIYSLSGGVIKSDIVEKGTNSIDITSFAPGVYILNIEDMAIKIIRK